MKVLHRFQESRYSNHVMMLTHSEFPVIKETPHGAWIDIYGHKKFVRLDARKRFACSTKAEALESYRARKERQVKILKRQLADAEAALQLKHEDDMWFEVLA